MKGFGAFIANMRRTPSPTQLIIPDILINHNFPWLCQEFFSKPLMYTVITFFEIIALTLSQALRELLVHCRPEPELSV